jgi:hypothetical protein
MDIWSTRLGCCQDVQVRLTCEVRVDATAHTGHTNTRGPQHTVQYSTADGTGQHSSANAPAERFSTHHAMLNSMAVHSLQKAAAACSRIGNAIVIFQGTSSPTYIAACCQAMSC